MEEYPDGLENLNRNMSTVRESGNSDVTLTVNLDTRPLAYAIACFLRATGKLDDTEFRQMIELLTNLIDKDQPGG